MRLELEKTIYNKDTQTRDVSVEKLGDIDLVRGEYKTMSGWVGVEYGDRVCVRTWGYNTVKKRVLTLDILGTDLMKHARKGQYRREVLLTGNKEGRHKLANGIHLVIKQ